MYLFAVCKVLMRITETESLIRITVSEIKQHITKFASFVRHWKLVFVSKRK